MSFKYNLVNIYIFFKNIFFAEYKRNSLMEFIISFILEYFWTPFTLYKFYIVYILDTLITTLSS